MCGISGYLAFNASPAAHIAAMNDVIAHRGPDDEGYVLFEGADAAPRAFGGRATPESCYAAEFAYAPTRPLPSGDGAIAHLALGHRRLSIVDVSPAGHQPMCTQDRRYWIVYNGEVYNHIELRQELERLGHRFLSHSDTEVILAAYREWGRDCLSRFNGMFAFLIYDRERKVLFAARDRFGVKPLYYWVSAHGIAFGSEIKQFAALPHWRAKVNGQRAYDFLNWGVSDHTEETLFSGVFQLRGGQALELDVELFRNAGAAGVREGHLPVYQWYRLAPKPFAGSLSEASDLFREKLVDAVKLRLRADVPVGSCLSGGLDSSSIVCVANQLLRAQDVHNTQKTFSACSDIAKYDERKWIELVTEATGVEPHYVYPSFEQLFEESRTITWHQDEPFGSTSIFAQWHVFRLAAENRVKVMLDGQGADEQLAGYHGYFGPHLAALLRHGHWVTLANEISAMKSLYGYSSKTALSFLASHVLPGFATDVLRKMRGRATATPAWLDCARLGCDGANPFQLAGEAGARTIQEMSHAQLTATNLPMLLHWEDRDSMAHSIESRVPFLDYRLVEFVLGLPDEYKLAQGVTKVVMRQGMSGVLPDAIRDRKDKLGFVTPEEVWLRQTAPELFRKRLAESIEACGGILRRDEAFALLDGVIDGSRPFSFLPWRMINFGQWLTRFSVETR